MGKIYGEGMKETYGMMKGIAKGIVVGLILLAIVATILSSTMPLDYMEQETTFLDGEWTQHLDGQTIPLATVDDYTAIPVGDTLVLSVQLPTCATDKALFFFSKDVEVKAYIEDVLVYAFETEEAFSFLKTPGHRWNFISLPVEYSGQTLRLELTSQFSNRFEATLAHLYFIQTQGTLGVVLQEKGFMLLAGVITLIMAVVSYVNGGVWKRKYIKQYYMALGNFYLCVSIWVLSMSGFTNGLFHRPVLTYICSVLFASFIPVTIYEMAKVICQQKSRRLSALGVLFWGNFIAQFALQYLFGISMLDMIVVTEAVYALGCCVYLWMMVDHYRACRGTPNLNIPFMTILIMIVGAMAEVVVLVLRPEATNLIGVASITGLLVYLIVNKTYLVYQVSLADMTSVSLERDYNKLQNTGLMEQIKAHFFFNTINTISALCKTDPAEADRAIVLFAKYMRAHMYLINQHDNIPFTKEMNLVESTLGIEAVRYPDSFTYAIHTAYVDFDVPPLCIQPIVENALLHGLRAKDGPGHLEVRTQRKGNCTVVTITDNGVGYDVSKGQSGASLGIKNLTKRVAIMANGTVAIDSKLDRGTTVTLTFPDGMV